MTDVLSGGGVGFDVALDQLDSAKGGLGELQSARGLLHIALVGNDGPFAVDAGGIEKQTLSMDRLVSEGGIDLR